MITNVKNVFAILVIILSVILFSALQYKAFDKVTHKAINKYIADKNSSIAGSALHQYLQKQLGMQKGLEEFVNNKMIFEWIGDGGEKEDAGARSQNHFLNPITNRGLLGNYSAPAWATLPVGAQPLSPISSWNDVRSYYYMALTSADKATRENYFSSTFQGVGQVMHAVEDMSVPAHTRNDPHLLGDGYETWAIRINDAATASAYTPYSAYNPYNSSFLIPQLFDTDQYDGTNSGITLSNSIGLAEYTNANFFSGDTINAASFPYPKTDNNKKVTISYTGPEATYNREYFVKDCSEVYCQASDTKNYSGYLLSAVDLNDYWRMQNPNSNENKPVIPILDENVHHDYAQFLIPRAIGYSSQVLSYFFRGQLETTFGEGNIKIKNASAETISSGMFELYYDNADGVRTLIMSTQADTLASGGEQTIPFTAPDDVTSYMLVYKGQLGSESNAVIGKFIDVGELVIFTVSLAGISGENLTKKSVLIWNPAINSTERGPIDYENTTFQEWYAKKVNIANYMFGSGSFLAPEDSFTKCGTKIESIPYGYWVLYNGFQPSGCQQITPGMIDTFYRDYLENTVYPYPVYHPNDSETSVSETGSQDIKAALNALNNRIFPVSGYSVVYFPGNLTYFTGFRTHVTEFHTLKTDKFDFVDAFWPFGCSITNNWNREWTDKFYGPLGYMGEFRGFSKRNHQGGFLPHFDREKRYYIFDLEKGFPHNYSYPDNKSNNEFFDVMLQGKYGENSLANVTVVQYVPYLETIEQLPNAYPNITGILDPSRTVLVQAQALYNSDGITGIDWVSEGPNPVLEAQIKTAIEMAYTLNNIPANDIRKIAVNIEIVK